MKEKQIELYDMGRTSHKAVPGMYEFIVNHADRFVSDFRLAEELRQQAADREQPGYSISQEHFSEMCRIWADAYNKGEFPINVPQLVFPDTPERFMAVKRAGRKIGILTSGSAEFTKILFNCSFRSEDSVTRKYADTQLGREIFHYDEDLGWTVDKKHPYGHYKLEVLSGVVITIILFLTGLWIIYESYLGFLEPSKLEMGYLAFGVMIFSAIVNEVMARLKIYYGKKENSISLVSDGVHSRVDVWASIAVLAGLFFSSYWIYADSLLALIIGLYILKESFSLDRRRPKMSLTKAILIFA